MLNKSELLKEVEEKYVPMLKEVNIENFTKCIAQFSGLNLKKVNDNVIKKYLLMWAENKYRFYEMLGHKLKVDKYIEYNSEELDVSSKLRELQKDYPSYALWLKGFKTAKNNKIESRFLLSNFEDDIRDLFPNLKMEGTTITHFFKKYLQAPDDLVTRIGRIWENQKIEGRYCISIDPVDMMLASENPYDWTSCYRLEIDNESSHADGCLAAILDDSSLITYIWNREGKLSLYNSYELKSVRYFRMRQWIAISPSATAIHFNKIYPGKSYSVDFERQLRQIVENLVNKEAIWTKNECGRTNCHRQEPYGYSEYSYSYIYKIKDSENETWFVYNQPILCPCGCGDVIPGSDDAEDDDGDEYEYNGEGFIAENFDIRYKGEWCDYLDDYCDDQNCEDCIYWNRCHPVCELDYETECDYADEAEENDKFKPWVDNIVLCGGHCERCEFYEEHHRDNEQEPDEE